MKPAYFTFGLIATLYAGNAVAADFGYNANSIAAHNIIGMQHYIVNRAIVLPEHDNVTPRIKQKAQDPDAYGEMIYYGEYGDDTGVLPLIGRSGGDTSNAYIGATWEHMDEELKFKSYPHMDTTLNLGMLEFGNNHETLYNRPLDLKFFGGYVGGDIENNGVDIDQNGGFFGVLAHQSIDDFDLNFVADFGLMANDVNDMTTAKNFNNVWVAVNLDAAYKFAIDEHLVLRPNVRGGYMWIFSPNYVLKNGENIDNKNFGAFELTPGIDIISDLGNGWSIGARGAYVMNFVSGGETYVEYAKIEKLKTDNYFEYSIKIEKYVDDLFFGINVGCHDGGRTGWFGDLTIKYLF